MMATCPLSRSVTEKKLSMLRSCCGACGRSPGSTITVQLSSISGSPHSGGAGGSCCRNRAMTSICSAVKSPDVPQLGMPAGDP